MPKNPLYADNLIVQDGGVIKTSAGTEIVSVSSAGVPSIKANIQDSLAEGSIYVGDSAGVTSEVTPAGDVTISGTGITTIEASSVTASKTLDAFGFGGLYVKKSAAAVYDFDVDGGVAGTITLTDTATLPDNAVVTGLTYDVITTCTSAADAATIKLSVPVDGDLSTAIAISDGTNPWDAGAHLGSVITPVALKTTAARALQIDVAGGENLTAGKVIFIVDYYVSL